jgi:hypothetical protein
MMGQPAEIDSKRPLARQRFRLNPTSRLLPLSPQSRHFREAISIPSLAPVCHRTDIRRSQTDSRSYTIFFPLDDLAKQHFTVARGMFDELPPESINVSWFSDSSLIMDSGKRKRMIGMLWQ